MTTDERAPAAISFGRYQLLAKLGKGGMGEVFLALARGELGFDKLVVVKRLLVPEEAADEEITRAKQMFVDEARLAARLNHPNVVQTNDVGIENGQHYLTMEYLEGQTVAALGNRLRKRGQTLDRRLALRIVADLLAGLQYAHELQGFDGKPLDIVHRDLSPHNVFLTYDGTLKILDFGVAKATINSQRTERGILKGKFAYMAPEQLTGDSIDRRADLFVVGILLWELLTERKLLVRETDALTVTQLLQASIPSPRTVSPEVPEDLERVVMRALERKPEARFQSARELREAVVKVAGADLGTAEEVGLLLAAVFSAERADVKATIQGCVARADEATAASVVTGSLPFIRPPSSQIDAGDTPARSRPLEQPTLDGTIVSGGVTRNAPEPSRRGALIALGALSAILAVLSLVMLLRRPPPVAAPAQTSSPPPAAEPVPPPAPAVTASVAATASSVEEKSAAAAPSATTRVEAPIRRTPVALPTMPARPGSAPATPSTSEPATTAGRRIFNTKLE